MRMTVKRQANMIWAIYLFWLTMAAVMYSFVLLAIFWQNVSEEIVHRQSVCNLLAKYDSFKHISCRAENLLHSTVEYGS
jgi:hypothetical protein